MSLAINGQFQTHPSYLATITEVTADVPQGPVTCEHDDYDYILEILKKIGSLHQDSIVWDTVADASLGLIEHERKDINLFAAHLLALLHQNHDGNGFLCIALIQDISDRLSNIVNSMLEISNIEAPPSTDHRELLG